MILVISENFDPVTDKLMLWLISREQTVVRVNEDTPVSFEWMEIRDSALDFKISVGDTSFTNSDIDCLIYRRGQIRWKICKTQVVEILGNDVLKYFNKELSVISTTIINSLCNTKPFFGEYKKRYANKLEYLQMATMAGFNIPNTIIGTTTQQVVQIDGDKITKPISDVFATIINNHEYRTLTAKLSSNDFVLEQGESFFPSLVQQRIDMRYEIRVFFYGKNVLHALAIKSSEQDWRGYGTNNRFLNFNLPNSIRNCLERFLDISGLSTGSIDILYSSDKKFYFLEVNPVGQFDFFYKYCNIDIEKEIVDELILCKNGYS